MKSEQNNRDGTMQLAEQIRDTCIEAAREGFREALMSGLCTEGAIEAAVSSMEMMDLQKIIESAKRET